MRVARHFSGGEGPNYGERVPLERPHIWPPMIRNTSHGVHVAKCGAPSKGSLTSAYDPLGEAQTSVPDEGEPLVVGCFHSPLPNRSYGPRRGVKSVKL
jgi:hypothetical protein